MLKSKCQQDSVPSGCSREGSPFPLLEATHVPWLVAPSSIFKASSVASSNLSVTLTLLPLSYLKTKTKIHTGIPRLIVLCFIAICRYCIFYRLKVYGNSVLSKSINAIFPTVFAHLMSLCHILVILATFQTFSLLRLLR